MQPRRAIAILLLASLEATVGCHNHVHSVLVLPQELLLTPKAGDVLTWKLSSEIQKVSLTIPKAMCNLTPSNKVGKGPDDDHVTIVVDSNTPEVKCKVLRQGNNGPWPINYVYYYDMTPSDNLKLKSPVPAPTTQIKGSCQGCGNSGQVKVAKIKTGDPGQRYQIICSSGMPQVPQVLPSNIIEVPFGVKSVNWYNEGLGFWTVTFPTTNPPTTMACSNANGAGGVEVPCTVNPMAVPTVAGSSYSYNYSVFLSTCGGGSTPGTGKLTLDGPPLPTPPQ